MVHSYGIYSDGLTSIIHSLVAYELQHLPCVHVYVRAVHLFQCVCVCVYLQRMSICVFLYPPQVEEFVMRVEGQSSLYGMQLDTVNSLILSLLPPVGFTFECKREPGLFDTTEDIKIHILRLLVQCLRQCCGMHIPYVSICPCHVHM